MPLVVLVDHEASLFAVEQSRVLSGLLAGRSLALHSIEPVQGGFRRPRCRGAGLWLVLVMVSRQVERIVQLDRRQVG